MSSFPRSLCYLIATYIYCCSTTTPTPTSSPTLNYTVESQCHVTYGTVGASFDLCPLTIKDSREQIKFYKVEDSRIIHKTTTKPEYNYVYYFNVGDELKSTLPICTSPNNTHQYCPQDTDCSQYKNTVISTDTAWAYQVQYDSEDNAVACWALSNSQYPAQWALLDEEDASLGVQLSYVNGDYDDFLCKSNRKFHIRFECEDNIRFIPDEVPLYEYSPCEYTVAVPSQYGCPIECNVYDNQLCSSHGLCGYDNTNTAPHCFCFNKYIGDDCHIFDSTARIPSDSSKTPPDNPFSFTFKNALDTGVDVTYDLRAYAAPESAAAQDGGVYIVHDKDYDISSDRQWSYYVAIAKVLTPGRSSILPDFCSNIMGPCLQFNGTECVDYDESWTGPGLVFQANTETETCFVLGRFGNGSPSAELYDQIDDPARGITIVYGDGSWCEEGHRNREFRVNLMCPRDQSALYDPKEETTVNTLYEYVEEEESCVYSFTMESAVACPYQCITNGTTDDEHAFTVCSRKGICAADPEAGFVRCLCDDGWKGVYCTQIDTLQPTESPTVSPTVSAAVEYKTKAGYVATTVILILVILVVLGIAYIVYKNQKMKISQQEDEIAFHKMTDKGGIIRNVITDQSGKRTFATIGTTQDDNKDNDDNQEDVR